MKTRWTLTLLIAGLALASIGRAADPVLPKPLRALMITGGCCHDYENQKRILAEGISARARVEWTVVHEGGESRDHKVSIYSKPDWAKGYDVVVHNECFGGVTDDAFVEGIAKAHEEGTGAVVIHCSMHSYRNAKTDAWRQCLGVSSFRHQQKDAVDVEPLKPHHPILIGFPSKWHTPNGELYEIVKVWPNCTPLAQAFGTRTQANHPCIWVNQHGKGRVFGTTLGHHNETMEHPVYLDLVTRGLLWASGRLQDNGKPSPGYAAENP